MSNQTLTTVLLAGGAGVLGAVVSSIFLAPESAPREEIGRNDAALTSLERTMQTLQSTNAELMDRIRTLEERPPVIVQADRAPVTSPESTSAGIDDEELQALVASLQGSNVPVPDNFVAVVGSALDEIRTQEEHERDEARRQSQIDAIEKRLTDLQTDLALSTYQVDEMRPVLLEQALARSELMEAAREGGDWMNVRGEMRELQTKASESLSQILTPEQLEEYEKGNRGFGGRRGSSDAPNDGTGRRGGGGRDG